MYFALAFLGVLLAEILFYLYCTRAFVVAERADIQRIEITCTRYEYNYLVPVLVLVLCIEEGGREDVCGQGTRVQVPGSKHICPTLYACIKAV